MIALSFYLALMLPTFGQANRDSTKLHVSILHSGELSFITIQGEPAKLLAGDVALMQDSTYFYCDSAIHYERSNRLEAFGNVRVVMPNGVSMEGRRMVYFAGPRRAEIYRDIILTDHAAKLETDRLTYYRNEGYGYYQEGGTLTNLGDTLSSATGYFYSRESMAYFHEGVRLRNPEFSLTTDTLGYNTETKTAIFLDHTDILSKDGDLEANGGYYDTEARELFLTHRAAIHDSSFSVVADTIEYNDSTGLGIARGNILVSQSDSSLEVRGNYGVFQRRKELSVITDEAVAIQFMDGDTLFIFADTFRSETLLTVDTLWTPSEDSLAQPDFTLDSLSQRFFRAYFDVSIFMRDLQGHADSLVYAFRDSTITLFRDPVIWSQANQLTGDTILIVLRNQQIDSLWVGKNSFLVSKEDTVGYNQIKGKEMRAKFRDNELRVLHVVGNSESLYFVKDDKDTTANIYQGLNKAISQEMIINFRDNQVEKIVFLSNPEGTFYPYYEIVFEENKLDGMQWRIEEKPEKPVELISKLIPRAPAAEKSDVEPPEVLPDAEGE